MSTFYFHLNNILPKNTRWPPVPIFPSPLPCLPWLYFPFLGFIVLLYHHWSFLSHPSSPQRTIVSYLRSWSSVSCLYFACSKVKSSVADLDPFGSELICLIRILLNYSEPEPTIGFTENGHKKVKESYSQWGMKTFSSNMQVFVHVL